jgi:signal transduction histidine kinase/DNA-binding response OmpR family regulator
MDWHAKAILSLLLWGMSFVVWSQPDVYRIDFLQDTYALTPHLQILVLDEDRLSVSELNAPEWRDRFVPFNAFLDQNYPHHKPGRPARLRADKVYWARVTLVNKLPGKGQMENWLLFTGKSEHTTVYLIDKEGRVRDTSYAGFMTPSSQKDFRFGNQYEDRVNISLPENDSATVFMRIQSFNNRKLWINATLTRKDFYHNWATVLTIQKNWLFIGFLLTFTFISLILYIEAQDKVFLYHALFQLGVFIYLLEFFGVMFDLTMLRDNPEYIQAVLYLALCLMDTAYLQFIRTFLKLWEKYPFWDRFVKALIAVRVLLLIVVMIIFYGYRNMQLADNISAYYAVVEYLGMVILLFFIRESGPQRLFLIGGTALLSVGIVSNALSVVAGTGIQFSYTQFGGFGEVLLFTLGLGYRMKTLIREERKNMVLKETDEFKTRFFTNITHEFRTPLTVIQGFADQLSAELKDPGQLRQLTLIKQNGERLVRLLNRILSLSRLQSGKMELNLRQSDIVKFMRYLVYSFQSFAWGKGIYLSLLTDLEKLEADFDAEKIQDAVTNLISNAIKFTPEGGKITVLLKVMPSGQHKGQILIQVKDTGIGMTEREIEHLFERFYHSGSTRKKGQGTGLGLSITRELIRLIGGTIEVSSKPGEGSAFSIYLPVTHQAPVAPIEELSVPDLGIEDESDRKPADPQVFDDEKPLALIVEDSYDVAAYLSQLLEGAFNVVLAYDGAEGIDKAIMLVPDIIVSDVIMPNKDGLELCQTLKNDERTSHIPIILATARATVEDRLAGLQRGADAYLAKPFNQDELFLYLQNFVQLRKKLQARYSNFQPNGSVNETGLFEMEDAFVSKMRQIVTEHLGEEGFGATQLAKEVGMSRSQLHRKLTALSSYTATAFINGIRLQKAKELLTQTNLTVSEIAYQIGLDPNYFTRLFREEVGVTPSEFRNAAQ